ncbi:SCP-like protein [Teladorsagia circumcincta]|uniref:SCP-like protein n=1 Tax=Teladorsagia circumcincta TaxID=45464 RepID=A0A2G9V548_TELCI|nr:SCP-like protein [Teladorsagia circumcincta]
MEYKLWQYDQWDCTLEQKAQDLITTCPWWTKSIGGLSRNFYTSSIRSTSNPAVVVANILSLWWGRVREYGSTDPENKYTNPALYNFANMAHSKTTGIGCAYKVCRGTRLTVMCLYNRIGYYTNSVMWEKGNACASDSECTTYPESTCSEGLCIKELEKPGKQVKEKKKTGHSGSIKCQGNNGSR